MSAPASPKALKKTLKRKLSPIETIIESSELAQLEKSMAVFDAGILEAFDKVRDGYSADRVVADPDLNLAFVDSCKHIGIVGDARTWNHRLLGLRKAGKLESPKTSRRTEFSWEECDPFLFASEIAWKQLVDNGHGSLDDIFCDPTIAAQFDSIAQSYAPDFPPLMYRWGALKLRKEAKSVRLRSQRLTKARLTPRQAVSASCFDSFPELPGVYLIHARREKRPFYAGESLNLRARFETWMKHSSGQIEVSFFVSEAKTPLLLAYQSLYVRLHQPRLNIRDLALS